jgi:hypothetical protein
MPRFDKIGADTPPPDTPEARADMEKAGLWLRAEVDAGHFSLDADTIVVRYLPAEGTVVYVNGLRVYPIEGLGGLQWTLDMPSPSEPSPQIKTGGFADYGGAQRTAGMDL